MSFLRRRKKDQREPLPVPQKPSPAPLIPGGRRLMLALEPRFLYDAAGLVTVLDGQSENQSQAPEGTVDAHLTDHATEFADIPAMPESFAASTTPNELIFVDSSVTDYQSLIDQLPSSAKVILLDPESDGLQQITRELAGYSDIQAVHILSHGESGRLQLGASTLSADTLESSSDLIAQWDASLTEQADILLYGCEVGSGEAGIQFVNRLAEISQADVAASDDLTGAADKGGDWDLEVQTDAIEATSPFLDAAAYEHLLNTPTLTASTPNLTPITEDDAGNPGQSVAAIAGADISGAAQDGIAIYFTDNQNGTWEFNEGSGWTAIGNVSTTNALLLSDTSSIRFNPNTDNAPSSNPTFSYYAWDADFASNGGVIEGIKVDVTNRGVSTNFSLTGDTAAITVSAVNDAPVLDNSVAMTMTGIAEDEASPSGDSVASIIASAGGDRITDVDSVLEGIAVTSVDNSNGTWQYSTNSGSTWSDFGAVNATNSRLLNSSALVRFVPGSNYAGSVDPGITFRAWDQSSGSNGATADASSGGGTTAFSANSHTASISVSNANDAPVLDNSGTMTLTTITEDQTSSAGDLISGIISSAGGDRITDPDSGASEGIAVHTLDSSNGTWQYSIDGGGSWLDVGTVSDSQALLLRSNDLLRFVPDGAAADAASVSFYAWDRTSGAAGSKADVSTRGTTTAFSTASESAAITVTGVNDAPVLDHTQSPTLTSINEDVASPTGDSIAAIVIDSSITDVDGGAVEAIAVTAADDSNGTWQYSTDNGGSWNAINDGSLAVNHALLLDGTLIGGATQMIRFVPNGDFNGSATITFRAWDKSSGSAGTYADTTSSGGTTAFSSNTDTAAITVNNVNDAPVLDNGQTPVFSSITEDAVTNTGNTVAELVVDGSITDADTAVEAIAITAVDDSNGTWQYTTNGGSSWSAVDDGSLAATHALLLDGTNANHRIRFVPNSNYNGAATITFRAWDTSSGTAGTYADTSSNGGTTPYSSATDTASITVNAANDAPILDSGQSPTLPNIDEDVTNSTGDTVGNIIVDGSITETPADETAVEAMVITAVDNSNGTWQYSTDGGTIWNNIDDGLLSSSHALLLDGTIPNHRIRFVPNSDFAGTATFTFHAWDKSSGSAGNYADASSTGGATPFSSASDTVSITMNPLQDAPDLDAGQSPALTAINEDDTTPSGDSVAAIIVDGSITDPDGAVAEAIAITAVDNSNGTWQYSTDNGGSWAAIDDGSLAVNHALLLDGSLSGAATQKIRFVPTGDFSGTATFTFRAWDKTAGSAGAYADTSANGGSTPYSTTTDSASITVNAVNDAPVLDNSGSPSLTGITENDTATNGDLVSAIIASAGGDPITDTDTGASEGIAIHTIDNQNGTWQYSTNGGTTWFDIGTVNDNQSLLLRDTDRVRFVPDGQNAPGSPPSISYYAWDQSSGTAGSKADASSRGGITAFSSLSETADISVTGVNDAPVLDNSGTMSLGTIDEDDAAPAAPTVAAIIASAGGDRITDVDTGASEGIAVIAVDNSNGNWQFNTGSGWTDFSAALPSASSATLLDASTFIRFVPTADYVGSATISFLAWDTTGYANGATAINPGGGGGSTPFSSASETASVTVQNVNDAPTFSGTGADFANITEDAVNNAGQQVSAIINGDINDIDPGASNGIAIKSINDNAAGTWEYSTNGGASWTAVGTVSDAAALLLRSTDYLRFNPSTNNAASADLTYYAWDQTSGSAGSKVNVGTRGGTTAFSSASDSATISVTDVNDAPTLIAASPTLPGISEDDTTNSGQDVATLVGSSIADVDTIASEGIAIYSVDDRNGNWQYSTDGGGSWNTIGTVSGTSALLLRDTDRVRFLPDTQKSPSPNVSFSYYAWDQTSGSTGTKVDVSNRGSSTAFSTSGDSASITISDINDAPVLDSGQSPALTAINEDVTSSAGDSVATIIVDGSITDPDGTAVEAIAITAVDNSNGTWQYSTNNGGSWSNIDDGSLAVSHALLLDGSLAGGSTQKIRFVPTADFSGTATLTFRAWDKTTGSAGSYVNTSSNGGTTAYSTSTDSISITVNAANDAPTLDNSGTPSLTGISEDDTTGTGNTVATIIASAGGDPITDIDPGALEGMAIHTVDNQTGTWQYSTNGGTTWFDIGTVSDSQALLLRDTDRVRFVPDGDNAPSPNASFSYYAWDQSSGSAGSKVNVSTRGGSTAFSSSSETADITVSDVNDAPVLDNTGTMDLGSIDEDETAPSAPTVAAIIASAGGDRITDVDTGAAEGIAVIGVDNSNGNWQYNTGSGWNNFSASTPSVNSATLLNASTFIRFIPNTDFVGTATISFLAWDTTSYANGTTGVNPGGGGGSTPFSVASETATITVTDINDAPIFSGAGADFTSISEDDAGNTGQQVADIINGDITDVDPGALNGIAIKAINDSSAGTWEYSTNGGASWTAVGVVSDASALLLRSSDYLRFNPSTNSSATADITYYAWDQTSGSPGGKVDVTTRGGTTAFSSSSDSASISITDVNDAPVLTAANPTLPIINENETNNAGQDIGTLLGASTSDPDGASNTGIAVTLVDDGNGTWQYSTNGGASWTAVGTVSESSALLLGDTDRIRFVPDTQNAPSPDASFGYYAWDQTSGSAGSKVDVSNRGGNTAFSTSGDTATISVTDLNDAPVLDNSGTMQLTALNEDPAVNTGNTVQELIDSSAANGGNAITDVDASAVEGIAVVGVTNSNGAYEYSTDGGTSWNAIPAGVSDANALLLDANARVRFVPNAEYNGSVTGGITFRAWDTSVSSSGTTGYNIAGTGGTTAFSTTIETATITINSVNDAPVIANLDGDVVNYNEGDPATLIGLATGVTDVDSSNLNGGYLSVTLTNGLSGDILSIATTATISTSGTSVLHSGVTIGSFNTNASDTVPLSISFNSNATPARLLDLVNAITYHNNSGNPDNFGANPTRTVEFILNDGDGTANGGMDTSATSTVTISIIPNNAAPTVINVDGDSVTFTENGPAVTLDVGSDGAISDIDDTDYNGGYLNISLAANGAAGDQLTIANDAGGNATIGIFVSGTTVRYNNVDIGTIDTGNSRDGANGNDLRINFSSAAASDAAVGALIQAIQFQNTSNDEAQFLAGRTVRFVANDGESVTANNDVTVNISRVNDAPAISLAATQTAAEQTNVVIDGSATITDADLDVIDGGTGDYADATLTIQRNGGADADDVFGFDLTGASFADPGGGILTAGGLTFATYTNVGGTLAITFTSTGTPATSALVNDVLQHITYRNANDAPPASVDLDYSFNDKSSVNAVQGTGGDLTDQQTITVTITKVNDAPVLTPAAPTLSAIGEDDTGAGNTGTTIAALVGATITDPDGASQPEGIAIFATTGSNGKWQYDNGSGWQDVGSVDTGAVNGALLLSSTHSIRFLPDGQNAPAVNPTLSYYAWDQSSGTSGTKASVLTTGGSTPFSTASDTASITVTAVNDTPALTLAATQTAPEQTVVDLDNTAAISDVDLDALNGGAGDYTDTTLTVQRNGGANADDVFGFNITGASFADPGGGILTVGGLTFATYTNAGGTLAITFTSTGTTATSALVDEVTSRITYQNASDAPPASVGLTYTFNDRNSINAAQGAGGDLSVQQTINVTITPVNDAPVLTATGPTLTAITEDDTGAGNTGSTIAALIGTNITDIDGPAVPEGIAIFATTGTNGNWQYSTGSGWQNVGSVDTGAVNGALLLRSTDSIRFLPDGDNAPAANPTFSFHAWDLSSGSAGGKASVLVTGGTTAFSTVSDTASIAVSAVNDAPVLSLGVAQTVTEQATVVLDNTAAIVDVDLDALNGGAGDYADATLTVQRSGGANADDVFGFDLTGASFADPGGGILTNGGLTFATYTNAGGTLAITFTSSGTPATTALVNEVVSRITYQNSSDAPPASVNLIYTINDKNTVNAAQGAGGDLTDQSIINVGITAVNDAPVLIPAAPSLTGITEDDTGAGNSGTTIASLVGSSITDGDGAAVPEGIAIFATTGTNGNWQYNTGSGWQNVGSVDTGAVNGALLLRSTDSIRFLPDGDNAPAANPTFSFYAWDITSGSTGTKASVLSTGGSTAFSTASDTASITVTGINDAPVLTVSATQSATEQTSVVLDNGAIIVDVDLDAINGGAGDYADATLVVSRNGGANAEDVFGFDLTGASFADAGGSLTSGGLIFATYTNAGGTLTITFTSTGTTATSALVNEVVSRITYQNSSDAPPASVDLNYVFNDKNTVNAAQGSGGDLTDQETITVNITAVNDAPVLAAATPTLTAITEDDTANSGTTIAALVGATITDADGAAVPEGIAIFATTGTNGTWQYDTGSGWQDVGSVDTGAVNGALLLGSTDSIRFLPDGQNAPAANPTFSYCAWDQTFSSAGNKVSVLVSGGNSAFSTTSNTASISVSSVNDAPVISLSATQTATEQTTTTLDNAATITDVDLDALNGGNGDYTATTLIVQRSGGANAEDVFGFNLTGASFADPGGGILTFGGLTFATYTNAGGTLAITFTSTGATATSALVNDVVSRITYQNTNDAPPATVDIDYAFNDKNTVNTAQGAGGDLSDQQTITVTINAVNDAPVLVPASPSLASITEDTTGSSGSTIAALVGASITDVDGVSAPEGIAIFATTGTNGNWQYNTGSGWQNVGSVDTGAVNGALLLRSTDSIRFQPDGQNAPAANPTFSFYAWDQSSGSAGNKASVLATGGSTAFSTVSDTASIAVSAVNDAPVLTLAPTQSATEQTAVVLDNAAAITDVDLDALNGGAGDYSGTTLTIQRNGGANAEDVFGFSTFGASFTDPGGGILNSGGLTFATYTNAGGTLAITFTSTGTTATSLLVNDVISKITYLNSSDAPPASVDLDVLFDDQNTVNLAQGSGGDLNDQQTITVNIATVNDQPSATNLTSTSNYNEDVLNVPITDIVVSDADAGEIINVTLTLANPLTGALTANDGATYIGGTGVWSISGTVATINTALANVAFQPLADNDLDTTISVQISDGLEDGTVPLTGTITLDVAPIPDAPIAANSVVSTTQNLRYTFAETDFNFSDPDTGDILSTVTVLSLPNSTEGTLQLNSASINVNDQINLSDLNSGLFTFTPFTDFTGQAVFTFNVSDGVNTSASSYTMTINISDANAPVVSAGGTLNYTENDTATPIDTTIFVADDNDITKATVTITSGYIFGEDILVFNDTADISSNWNNLTGELTLTAVNGSATPAVFESALRAVNYQNTVDDPNISNRIITWIVTDNDTKPGGPFNSIPATSTVQITAVNDAPVVSAGGTLGYQENDAPTAIDPALEITDVDSTNITGATVAISNGYVSGQDVLAFPNSAANPNITGTWDAATGILTLTGTDTVLAYRTALRDITYVNTEGAVPLEGSRTVTYIVNDGTDASAPADSTVTVTAVNDVPVVTAGAAINYTEGDPATVIDNAVTIVDPDSASITGAQIRITTGYNVAEDVLSFTDTANITGSWDGAGTLTLSGTDTIAAYQAALRSITYQNTNDLNPVPGNKTISFEVNDGSGSSTPVTSTITVFELNDLPIVTAGAQLDYTEGDPPTVIDSTITLTDNDNSNFAGAIITIDPADYINGADQLAFTDTAFITGTWDAAAGTLTLNGTTSIANYQAALRSITYENLNGIDPVAGNRSIQFVVSDGTDPSLAATSTVNVIPIDTPPIASNLSAPEAFVEDGPAVNLTNIVIADIDSANVTATLRLSDPTAGILSTGTSGAVTSTFDAVTGVWTASGALADVNTLLAATSFTPNADYDLPVTITTEVSDATTTISGSKLFSVTTNNDAPTLDVNTGFTVDEGTSLTISPASLQITDPDTGAVITYTLQTAPANGTLFLNSTPLGAADTFTQSDIDNGLLTYLHNGSETVADSFIFNASDGTNPALGPTTVNITVNPVNDAPVLDNSGTMTLTTIAEDANAPAGDTVANLILSAGGNRISDVDNVNEGIALVAVDDTNGTWEYNIGSGWNPVGAVSASSARLLADTALLRFVPNADFNGSSTIDFHAWDQSSGVNGGLGDASSTGGSTAFSSTSESAAISITPVNDAPVLDAGQSPQISTIQLDDFTSQGDSIADMVVNNSITDVDGAAVEAIAVTGVDNTNGTWQYSTDNGSTWTDFSGVTGAPVDLSANARLLDGTLSGAGTHRVRFVPNPGWYGLADISFCAWDRDSGTAGLTADTSTNGGTTAFSTSADTAAVKVNVAPVAVGDSISTAQDQTATFNVLGNDTDGNNDVPSMAGYTLPSIGTLTYIGNGSFSFTPTYSFSGTEQFTYDISDGFGGTATGTVTINVQESIGSQAVIPTIPYPSAETPVYLPLESLDGMLYDGGLNNVSSEWLLLEGMSESTLPIALQLDQNYEVEYLRPAVNNADYAFDLLYGGGPTTEVIRYDALIASMDARQAPTNLNEGIDELNSRTETLSTTVAPPRLKQAEAAESASPILEPQLTEVLLPGEDTDTKATATEKDQQRESRQELEPTPTSNSENLAGEDLPDSQAAMEQIDAAAPNNAEPRTAGNETSIQSDQTPFPFVPSFQEQVRAEADTFDNQRDELMHVMDDLYNLLQCSE